MRTGVSRGEALAFVVAVAAAMSSGPSCAGKEDAERGFARGNDAGPGGFDFGDGAGIHACAAAQQTRSSVGCEYYAIHMDGSFRANNGCFVAFVANTYDANTRIHVTFAGDEIDLARFAKVPRGAGRSLTYEDYDAARGLAPGDVALLFLAGPPEPGPDPEAVNPNAKVPLRCPIVPARSTLTQIHGSGVSHAFRIRTDYPVVAYQMLPYGGGNAAVTGATLLLPTSAFDTNYIAVNAYAGGNVEGLTDTSLNIVAAEDDTHVTILPKVPILAAPGVRPGKENEPATYTLQQGQHLQITQPKELTGSPVQSDKPIGLYAGQPCMNVPANVPACDHGEQQIPPVRAMGSEHAGVPYRQRGKRPEKPPWRIIAAVDGTALQWEPAVGGPTTMNQGDVVELETGTPFVVRSQDADHPFLLLEYMSGGSNDDGYGDADVVRSVPTAQYLDRYVFFTDPTYPETNLVVVRKRGSSGYADVELDCAGTIGGWKPFATGFEYAHVDLVRHDFQKQGRCDNGRHEMKSREPFGLWVWGWGSPETKESTTYVSYGYPAGENLVPLTGIVVPPNPR
jgi:hypothetical protein